jgi:type II secretory pathway predicted ATPase ExeA
MYETFFDLNRRPFATTPDPSCFVATPLIQETFDELAVCVENGQGIAVLTAPAGIGKTLMCKKLASELSDTFQTIVLGSAICNTRRSLLQAILYELNQPFHKMAEQELRLAFFEAAKQVRPSKHAIMLILDEAHLLNSELLEEIRSVTNLTAGAEPLVRVVLAGQLALEEVLAEANLEAFNQRIRCHVSLQPFTRTESADYIMQRLAWAGGNGYEAFTPEAIELATHASGGVPRCLNQLCDHSMLLAYVAEQVPVSGAIVREALVDMQQLPLQWNALPETPHLGTQAEETPETTDETPVVESVIEDATSEFDSYELASPSDSSSFEVGASEPEPAGGAVFEIGGPDTESAPSDTPTHDDELTGWSETEIVDCPETLASSHEPETLAHDEEKTLADPVEAEETIELIELQEAIETSESPDAEDVARKEVEAATDEMPEASSALPEMLHLDPMTGQFEEEPVVDHYAAIDASDSMHGVSGIVWDITSETPSLAEPDAVPLEEATAVSNDEIECSAADSHQEAPLQHESEETVVDTPQAADDDFLPVLDVLEPRPDRTIDEIMPLLQECADGVFTADTATPIHEDLSDCQTEIRLAVEDSGSHISVNSNDVQHQDTQIEQIAQTGEIEDDEIEEEIGSEVLEICIETQEALLRRLDAAEMLIPSDPPSEEASGGDTSSDDLTTDGNGLDEPLAEVNSGVLFDEATEPVRPIRFRSSVFDVIEPETPMAGEATEPETVRNTRDDTSHNAISRGNQRGANRPYGRLFSELRRRQRRA